MKRLDDAPTTDTLIKEVLEEFRSAAAETGDETANLPQLSGQDGAKAISAGCLRHLLQEVSLSSALSPEELGDFFRMTGILGDGDEASMLQRVAALDPAVGASPLVEAKELLSAMTFQPSRDVREAVEATKAELQQRR